MAQKFLNNFDSVFVASVKDTPGTGTPATELDYGILRLSDGAAAFLTNPTGGDFYVLTAFKREGTTETNREIMRVTAVDNSTTGECRVTVQRGQEGTSVKAYLSGDYVSLRLTAGAVNNWVAQFDIAKNNADTATNQANIATDKANIATNQANIATDKANIATNQAAAAAASYDSFDDRYLGAKASDPTLDNDGNALIEGALYWNSTAKETRTWNGTAWVTTSAANAVSRGGDTMTGPLSVPAGASGAQVPRAQETYGPKNGQLAGMRNKVINGKMEIAQRGTSFTNAVGTYTLDRWAAGSNPTAATFDITQSSDVPTTNEFQNSLRVTISAADASIAATDQRVLFTTIEGYNARDLIGRTFTLSFWVRSSKTGTHCISFGNSVSDRSYVSEYTVNTANTWEFKTIVVDGGLITTGTWNWTNGIGVSVRFALAAGSNFQTTPNAWQTGNLLATANQVNVLDTLDNIFAITGVQLEVGKVATPFEHRFVGAEFALCQRYYCITRGSATGYASAAGDSTVATPVYWPVTMRAVPTTTNSGGTVTNASAAALDVITTYGARFHISPSAAGVSSVTDRIITASAEL